MNKSSLWLCGAVVAVVLVSFSRSNPSAPPSAPTSQGGSKLGGAMEEIGGAVKALQEALKKDDGLAAALPDVWKAQRAVIDAKSELPKAVSDMTDEKAKHKAEIAYHTQMQDLLRAFLDVETAVINGDAKKAEKALRQADNLKSAGHGQFRPRDGK